LEVSIKINLSDIKQAGIPEEMAGAALILYSKAGSYITGADLKVTGGVHL
jgi:NAD(P)-dependent dehydrogenase (short-subunit alcohol dehydrogenase family)